MNDIIIYQDRLGTTNIYTYIYTHDIVRKRCERLKRDYSFMRFVAGWYAHWWLLWLFHFILFYFILSLAGTHTGGYYDYLLQEKRARIAAESIAKEQSGESWYHLYIHHI
jgi:hypothetical protein